MDLDTIYRHRFEEKERLELESVWRVLVEHSLQRWIPEDATVLDVGAGYCHFINNVHAKRRIAFDANPAVAKNCAGGVEFVHGTDLASLGERRVDVVFMSNFLEHLEGPNQVLTTLAAAHGILSNHGRIVILQPNFALVGPRYFDFIDHKTILTDASLVEALELTGFTVTHLKRRYLPYTSKSRLPKWPWLVRLYLLCPPAQFWLGKQTLVVCSKA